MKRLLFVAVIIAFPAMVCQAGFMDDLKQQLMPKEKQEPAVKQNSMDEGTVVKGLKEALATGTDRAVKAVSKQNGYFGNQLIKIAMPEKIQNVANILGKVGFQKQVDDFVLSMNRAAEKAAPQAAGHFATALKEMSFEDAKGILKGGNTSATEYFKKKTSEKLYNDFKPVVSKSMGEVGVTRNYQEMMGKYEALPLVDKQSLDLDHYVTNKSLDGLFTMLGEEEKKIRTNPVARTTDLLRKVFGK